MYWSDGMRIALQYIRSIQYPAITRHIPPRSLFRHYCYLVVLLFTRFSTRIADHWPGHSSWHRHGIDITS